MKAIDTLTTVMRIVDELHERAYESELYRVKGAIQLQKGAIADGEANLRRAIEIAQETPEAGKGQALRRHVDEAQSPRRRAGHAAPHLAAVEGGGQEGGRHAPRLERLDLVGHQRHQRRDDEGGSAEEGSGELIGQALATTGRGHQEEAASPEQGLDRLSLTGPESRIAEPSERSLKTRPAGSLLGDHHGAASGRHPGRQGPPTVGGVSVWNRDTTRPSPGSPTAGPRRPSLRVALLLLPRVLLPI